MSAKTTFWYAVVAVVALGSAMAVPVAVIDDGTAASGNEKVKVQESVEPMDTSSDVTTAGNEPWQQTAQEGATNFGESKTPSVDLKLPMEKTDRPEVSSDVEIVTKPNQPGSTLPPRVQDPVQGQYPKPYYTGGVQTINLGPAFPPFFLEFFQPFQGPQPHRHHQQSPNPFFASNGQYDPFVNPMRMPLFDQLINSYTQEFRTPGVIILKPKRNVVPNTTISAIPPIPLLMNIMLNAFRQNPPSDMLEALEKSMVQVDNVDTSKDGPPKPIGKTTTKTEIIDGHIVQTNETTYSDGDENHKTFYHFKEIQVLPEKPNKKIISNEQVVSTVKDDSESQKEETNEIKPIGSADGPVTEAEESKQNDFKKAPRSVTLDDHFQTAAATYYAPYAPYGPRPSALFFPRPNLHYGGPYPAGPAIHGGPYPAGPAAHGGRPQAPVSLHGDTHVNQLAAAQQQASGAQAMLPPDVELIDVHGKPQRGGPYYYNNVQHRDDGRKFPGRKGN